MLEQLSDEDRAAIAAAWVGCAFGSGGARALQAAAEATFLAGKAAGRLAERKELAAATQPMTKDEYLAWWTARGYRWDHTTMLFVKDEDAARVEASGRELPA